MAVFLSKFTSKYQTVIPYQLRARLNLKLGDFVRYCETDIGVIIDKLPPQSVKDAPVVLGSAQSKEDALSPIDEWDSPQSDKDILEAFDEWGSPADVAAYRRL
jgi:bifunctional DNA-binding transcriptional regulator/antitoxin component of YhaV-PrlF toxin-antitoxin module